MNAGARPRFLEFLASCAIAAAGCGVKTVYLHDGKQKLTDVSVVVWGDFGRTPRLNKDGGRDHWPQAMFALVAGGGFRMGQVIGATTARAERPVGGGYVPQNLLATLYRKVFAIDPATTLTDHSGRPIYLLDERDTIRELS